MITYLVLDLKKKKFQVGSTISEETGRPYIHFTDKCPNPVLRNATRKRPQDFFVFISEDDGLDTREAEQESLDFYHGTPWCYNLSPHADGGWDHVNNLIHSAKDEQGRSLHTLNILHKERNEEGKSVRALKHNEELHREKDERGKSLHSSKLHEEKDEQGRSLLALRSLVKCHEEKDEQGRSLHALRTVGKVHEERDEQGRSLHALRALGRVHEDKNEQGKSLHALKCHKDKDEQGRSIHAMNTLVKSLEEKDEWGRSAISAKNKNAKSWFFTDAETGEVFGPFPSSRVAAKEMGENRSAVIKKVNKGKLLNGYLITSE